MTTTAAVDEKAVIIRALYRWVRQRPGLEFCNYGDVSAYRSEMRGITKDRHDAEALIRAVELSSMTATVLKGAFRAYSGRLQWVEKDGKAYLDYCTGQYWPTEYRRAVAAVCATALWDWYREDYAAQAKDGESPGSAIRRRFRETWGKRMQERWFD